MLLILACVIALTLAQEVSTASTGELAELSMSLDDLSESIGDLENKIRKEKKRCRNLTGSARASCQRKVKRLEKDKSDKDDEKREKERELRLKKAKKAKKDANE
jgi:hypothetical protein